jgi:alkanesulfonate monooxygenase SsuD/methylene tetrahydromethanopterin reductase-like flavin-dependent oxidoreductase (luciferase family)
LKTCQRGDNVAPHASVEKRERTLAEAWLKASAEQFGPGELLNFSCLAETVGFDSVFVSDHFQPWRHHGGHASFSFSWLWRARCKNRAHHHWD